MTAENRKALEATNAIQPYPYTDLSRSQTMPLQKKKKKSIITGFIGVNPM